MDSIQGPIKSCYKTFSAQRTHFNALPRTYQANQMGHLRNDVLFQGKPTPLFALHARGAYIGPFESGLSILTKWQLRFLKASLPRAPRRVRETTNTAFKLA